MPILIEPDEQVFSLESQCFRLKSMDAFQRFRVWLTEQMDGLRDESVPEFAERAGVAKGTIYGIMGGSVDNPRRSTIEKIQVALGREFPDPEWRSGKQAAGQTAKDTIQSYGIEPLKPDEIPLVYIWEFPLGVEVGQMREKAGSKRRGVYKRRPENPADPELVWVRLQAQLSDHMMANDDVLVSPELKDLCRDEDFVLIETEDQPPEIVAGRLQVVSGKMAVKTRAGRRFEEGKFRILGKVVWFGGPPR